MSQVSLGYAHGSIYLAEDLFDFPFGAQCCPKSFPYIDVLFYLGQCWFVYLH